MAHSEDYVKGYNDARDIANRRGSVPLLAVEVKEKKKKAKKKASKKKT